MASDRGSFPFKEILPRLLVAYETGRLVPFIGLGMSRKNCADWAGMVGGLEGSARIKGNPLTDKTLPEELIRRADRAIRTLRALGGGEFEHALAQALFVDTNSVPEQMQALAKIWWPLVLTTNYDDFFVKAFAENFDSNSLAVVGRGSEDCQRVLTSLRIAGRSLLWALQGHVPASRKTKAHESETQISRHERLLSSELVIDHSEYRRVTYREPHFRRAFGEVFRDRSFLFLGSGLKETYIQELFGEVLELYGPSTRGHYALMPYGEVDPQFMYARFQIAVVEYGKAPGNVDHSCVPKCLEELRDAIESSQTAPVSWSWGSAKMPDQYWTDGIAELEVVRGPLPTHRFAGECLVVSAGGSLNQDGFIVSPSLQETLSGWCGWEGSEVKQPDKLSSFVGEYEGCDAYAVRAQAEDRDEKDLLQVRKASRDLFNRVAGRYRVIRMQLLASGGNDSPTEARWAARPFPARFSFVETVRAWAEWRRESKNLNTRLVLHVVDPSVTREIASGRIDVLELLRCPDICFWTETIENDALVERRRFQKMESDSLESIVSELCLDKDHWNVEVSPLAGISGYAWPVPLNGELQKKPVLSMLLSELGLIPGSTLHFRRVDGTRTVA